METFIRFLLGASFGLNVVTGVTHAFDGDWLMTGLSFSIAVFTFWSFRNLSANRQRIILHRHDMILGVKIIQKQVEIAQQRSQAQNQHLQQILSQNLGHKP